MNRAYVDKMTTQLKSIRHAIPTIKQAVFFVKCSLRPGISEIELTRLLILFLRKHGYRILAFPPIIAFGPNAAYPHHKPSNRKLQFNQIVLVDFGFKINGWCTDLTRTYYFGQPDKRFRRIYQTVRKAQAAAIQKLRTSRNGREVDAAARAVIARAGYKKAFRHSTGHGVGKKIHQPPWLSAKRKRRLLLKDGDVVTVEPGIYIKGWGGVRIEDMVLVSKRTAVLTEAIKK